MRLCGWAAIPLALGLVACDAGEQADVPASDMETPSEVATIADPEPGSKTAIANLQTAEGKPAGTATATGGQGTILLSLRVEGLPAGQHGVHVHMVGKCEAPTFESAGGHWNPTQKKHGLESPQGQHAGDMPNLTVGEDGRGSLSYRLEGGDFEALMDADGAAMVVHATADDQMTDPSGNSGNRIACGVFSSSA